MKPNSRRADVREHQRGQRRQRAGRRGAQALAVIALLAIAIEARAEDRVPPPLPSSGSAVPERVSHESQPNINWAGLGVRFGIARWTLNARALPAQAHLADFDATVKMLTPTVHLGGDRTFVKIDFAIGTGDHLRLYGLGFYPLNYGYFIAPIRLFPYGSLGATLNYGVLSADGANPRQRGVLAGPRAALGVKWRPLPNLCGSLEIGYLPRAVGVLADVSSGMPGGPPAISGVGGMGRAWDVSLGIELL